MKRGEAASRWTLLDNQRRNFIKRCEKYSRFTLPKICLTDEYKQDTDSLTADYHSVGAQAVNHVTNKLMLAMFAPSRPFIRLEPSSAVVAQLEQTGVAPEELRKVLAQTERKVVRELDKLGIRPKLYELLKHLVVVGNCLLYFDGDNMRVIGVKRYVVKRNLLGNLVEVILREQVCFDELEEDAQKYLLSTKKQYKATDKVSLYKWLKWKDGKVKLSQHIDNQPLPEEFDGAWKEEDCPYKVLTWDLADDSNYGTGLVENYEGDFGALSTLTEAQLNAAILASEFRWLLSSTSQTKPEDFERSQNGSVLAGEKDDISLIQNGKVGELQVIQSINQDYIQRIGRGFLLGAAVVRDAERVTAEEIRMQATELETSFGGIYSRLASDLQTVFAKLLLKSIGVSIAGTEIDVVIVTGLDALSRTGDLEALRGAMQDLIGMAQIPPQLLLRFDEDALVNTVLQGWGVDTSRLLLPAAQYQQKLRAMQQQQAAAAALQAGAVAGAENAATGGMNGG